ncbi:MAG: InlB B-repeat-containing protein [Bacteroidales bacterium]|jgi:uncharacterized repeat protein (TIGR02543 family)|nr:InlB B-repeat-containing protein [Bacteroidales bacterium]
MKTKYTIKRRISIFIALMMFASVFAFLPSEASAVTYANSANNYISAPSTVKANQIFTLSLRGDRDITIGTETGETKFVPSSWEIETPNQYLYDSTLFDFFENENLVPYSTKVKIKLPGRYTIRAVFYESTFDYNGGFSFWEENTNVDYNLAKSINVKGTVKFNPSKGKLKSNKKTKVISQKSKIGKLPKPTRKGYSFKGWYTKKSGKGSKIKSSTKIVFKGATKTYYAKWKKK